MDNKQPYRGIFTIPSTPFLPDGGIDVEGFKRVVDFCIGCGAHGLVYPVNASEFTHLSDVERMQMSQVLVERNNGRLPAIIGVAGVTKEVAAGFAAQAKQIGADGVIAMPPYLRNGNLSADAIFAYYQAISDAAGLPVFIQNYVPPIGTDLSVDFLLRLCREIEHVDYIKEETVPSTIKLTELQDRNDGACKGVFGGAGGRYLIEEYRRGSAGNMPGCHVTDVVVGFWNALEAGDRTKALHYYKEMAPLFFYEHQIPGTYKEVLKRRGVIDCAYRRNEPIPADEIGSVYLDEILAALEPLMTWGEAVVKITEIQTFVVGNPWKNWVFLKVMTDEGLTGLGEATGGLSTRPNVADLEELSRFVIGENPLNPENLFHKMRQGRFLQSSTAMCGIEIACWDILGKHLGVPVWQVLGGKFRDKLRVYGNGWYRGPREPGFFAERAAGMVELGYTALKFDPFGGAYLLLDGPGEGLSLDIVRAVREAVGPEVDLLIEGHDRLNVAAAIRVAKLLEQYRPMLYETPVNSMDIDATNAVAASSPVPIACGERYDRLEDFARLLAKKQISIVQPEAMHLGIGGARKACAIAEAHDALVACHQAQSPLCTSVNVALHASVPNFLIHENFDDNLEPWTWDLLDGVPRVVKGYLQVGNRPGLGVELNEEVAKRHPYGPTNFLRLFEEGWETRRPG